MKTHFDKKEKELIRELYNKLNGKKLNADNMIKEIAKIIGDSDFEIYRNMTNDIRYDYILYYKDIEIGIEVDLINEHQFKIENIHWHEH